MTESVRDRWLSIGMSVLLHGSLVALLAIGWWHFRRPTPAPSLPINATVVDARTLKGVGTASTPSPKLKAPPQAQPPPPSLEGPPPPTPDELAIRQQAAKAEAEHEAKAQQQLLARQQAEQAREEAQKAKAAAEQAAAEQAAEAQKAAEAKAAAQAKKLAEVKAEAKKKAAAKLAAQKKLAEERKLAEEKKLAKQRQLAAEREAEAERAARVADLQQSLQEEERAQAAQAASGALASWQSEITSRIQNAWIKPPTAQPGIECVLNVSLVPGGSVTGVSIGRCNGDDAVRQSIQTAVYNASPLPPPPNGIPFPRQLIITFKPTT